MLLDPEKFELKRYKQHRSDGEEFGDSGPLYLGSSPDYPTVLIKQSHAMHAANEYIGCTLGHLLSINTPRAWLFLKHKQIKYCSFKHSVGIEYLEGLSSCSANILLNDTHREQTIQAYLLHLILYEEDSKSMGLWHDQVFAYDFLIPFALAVSGMRS